MTQPNGPRAGRGTGRFRNTLVNNASKNSFPTPVVGPSAGYGYGAELGQLGQNLLSTLSGLKMQKGLLNQTFSTQRAEARSARVAGAQATEADALQRGILGSSSDLAARSGVVAQQKTDVAAAIQEKLAGQLGLRQDRLAAQNTYHTGVFDVMARKAAEEAQMATQAFYEDAVMRQGDETSSRQAAFIQQLKALLAGRGGGTAGNGQQDPFAGMNDEAKARIAHLLREGL